MPCRSRRRWALIALAILATSAMPGLSAAQAPQISESALRQIQALYADKASWSLSERKLGSKLVLEIKKRRGDAVVNALPQLRSTIEVDRDGRTLVDIRADLSEDLLARIEQLGGEVVNSFARYRAIRARMPMDELEALASEPAVASIRPAGRMTTNKINTSQGDVAHNADIARGFEGVDGTGITVGVISDGVDSLAALQASGDLPPVVTVLPGQAGSGSEGTAMLEIVHDLAPGAELLFATALGGEAQFAQNILDLRAAGADVIVDDVFYFAEGVFQDDIIAAAVNQVTSGGALYFSSAGNSGNLNDGTSGVWEGDFVAIAAPPVVGAVSAHDFGGGTNYDVITADSPSLFTLHWSDPLGGAGNDYDLLLLDPTRSTIFDVSADTQNGDDDPLEAIDSGPFNDTGNTLVIVRSSGANRFLHLNANRGRLLAATAGQTSGHNSAVDAFGVAAVDVATAAGTSFTGGAANHVEPFSSDGPRRVFFLANGTAITPGNLSSTGGALRQKPDVAAADGVATATPGFDPFFGTSAAAPHAAAIAALMLDKNPTLTPAQVRSIFNATALDIEAAGADRDSGVGIVMADSAVAGTPELVPLIFTDGFESGNTFAWSLTVP
jgi:hypothetical protein